MDLPKRRDQLRAKVLERGVQLRHRSLEDLLSVAESPDEEFVLDGIKAWITTWVEEEQGAIKVIIQGNLQGPVIRAVELDGFRRNADGSLSDVPLKELIEWS